MQICRSTLFYKRLADQSIAQLRTDHKEGFNFRYQLKHDPLHVGRHSAQDPKPDQGSDWIWEKTRDLVGFESDTVAWWQGCLELSRCLVRLFALALDLDEDYFDHIVTHPGSDGLYICYPGTPENLQNTRDEDGMRKKLREAGIGSHTDMQCFTLLWQDDSGGLEVLKQQDGVVDSYEWIEAVPKHESLVVNIADFLQRLSNDRFRSTVHRVYNSQSAPRYSMPFFFGFNYDAECAVVPTCVDEAHPLKYEPISCGKVRSFSGLPLLNFVDDLAKIASLLH